MTELQPGRSAGQAEFVGTTVLDTIGLVIPNVDYQLLGAADYLKNYRSIGILSSRTGAAGQINAIDEAVKRTNTEVLSIQLPRDTKGWGGHGNYIVIGGDNPAETHRAIELALDYTAHYAGELYISGEGHLELTYSARAGEALQMFAGAPAGEAFGFIAGSPAAVGMVMADTAMKAGDVALLRFMDASHGTSHTNEVIVMFTGDASAVEAAVKDARAVGLQLLRALGSEAKPVGTPYLL